VIAVLHWLRDIMKISEFFKFNNPNYNTSNFQKAVMEENIRKGRILAKAMMLFVIVFAILDVSAAIVNVNDYFHYMIYLIMYLLMLCTNAAFLLAFKKENLNHKIHY
jgi:hypothetical protein